MSTQPESDRSPDLPGTSLREVRYSLPEIMAELKLERTTGAFSQEKLYQAEIAKLFPKRKKRRVL